MITFTQKQTWKYSIFIADSTTLSRHGKWGENGKFPQPAVMVQLLNGGSPHLMTKSEYFLINVCRRRRDIRALDAVSVNEARLTVALIRGDARCQITRTTPAVLADGYCLSRQRNAIANQPRGRWHCHKTDNRSHSPGKICNLSSGYVQSNCKSTVLRYVQSNCKSTVLQH